MKTSKNNLNFSYSKLLKTTNSIASKLTRRVGLVILSLAAYVVMLCFMTDITLAGSAICFAAVISFKSLKLDIQDINVDFDMSDIIADLENDWR